MSIAIICPNREMGEWVAAFEAQGPTLKVEVWPNISDPEEVEFALCWNHPDGVLQQFPNLRCISSLGAGVEHLLNDTTLPPDIPLVRIVDDALKQSMAEYVMLGALEYFRCFKEYRRQQELGEWAAIQIPHISKVNVGIMGCGALGRFVAEKLSDFGFTVSCWSRSPKEVKNIIMYSGNDALKPFLGKTNILVCMLALTSETADILNAQLFDQLPSGSYLINVARGGHLLESDLLAAIDSGKLSGALLDVLKEGPLGMEHPFRIHKKITITPHIASITNPEIAVAQVLENYRRVLTGELLLNRLLDS
jgi:glyoxylate/hydroxypyruvate reductase A